MKVRSFERTVEPSFPSNESLPKKDEEKFDTRFNEWYDDVKINLDRMQDQLTKFFRRDLNDGITETKKEATAQVEDLSSNTDALEQNINTQISSTNASVQDVINNQYSV